MSTIVVYNSKTGFTKRYAEWITEQINCDKLSYKDFSQTAINAYDIIIFGSRLHAGKIEHLDKIKAYFSKNSKQKLLVFVTGATPSEAENAINKVWTDNFTQTEIKSIPHFYMQSGLNYEEMRLVDRTMMKMVAMILGKKKDKSSEEAGFEQAIRSSYDISSKEYIVPLVKAIEHEINR